MVNMVLITSVGDITLTRYVNGKFDSRTTMSIYPDTTNEEIAAVVEEYRAKGFPESA